MVVYSENGGFRNSVGTDDSHGLGVAYQQWWHTPYVGLGATYAAGSWRVTGEVITSPFVVAEDKDHHNQRDLLFTEDFAPDWMVGLSLGAEYAVSVRFSLTTKRGCLSSQAFTSGACGSRHCRQSGAGRGACP